MQNVIFVAVGYEKHLIDGIVPRTFRKLEKKYAIKVYYCNGLEIDKTIKKLKHHKRDKVVAIDVGFTDKKSFLVSVQGGIRPAFATQGLTKKIGDIGYIVNISQLCTKDTLYKQDKKTVKKVRKMEHKLYMKLEEVIPEVI